jgi:hypothetical protein
MAEYDVPTPEESDADEVEAHTDEELETPGWCIGHSEN